jgi:hypothetical protein
VTPATPAHAAAVSVLSAVPPNAVVVMVVVMAAVASSSVRVLHGKFDKFRHFLDNPVSLIAVSLSDKQFVFGQFLA